MPPAARVASPVTVADETQTDADTPPLPAQTDAPGAADVLADAQPVPQPVPLPVALPVAELTRPMRIETVASLNPIMVDGTGMCGGCRVQVKGEMLFACVDGPEFDAHAVDFKELSDRLIAYRDHERHAAEHAATAHEAAGACGSGVKS